VSGAAEQAPRRPRDLRVEANRLRLRLLDWSLPDATGDAVLLLHGVQEHAHAWDFVAPRLAGARLRVLALDWRGHGESEWVGRGGYYHFADYVADLGALARALGGRVTLVGHSMGGNAALTYAGTEPDRVRALVSIEGLGPPDASPEDAPARFLGWLADLERSDARPEHSITLDEATSRLAERFPLWPPEAARHMALHGTCELGDGTSRRTWRFDPLHRTRSPQPYYVAQARAFWARVRCPVLYVEGTQSFISAAPFEIDQRLAALGARRHTIAGAGHHPHLERPEETARSLLEFLLAGSP
jgi:pimeloyl-ACP methyl ester carboxylesterase